MDDAMSKLYGSPAVTESDRIRIKAPDIAENGAVVPITVKFDIPDAESVSIIAEHNPAPLARVVRAVRKLRRARLDPDQDGQDLPVHAVVKAGGKLYRTSKEVKVTIGGCGG